MASRRERYYNAKDRNYGYDDYDDYDDGSRRRGRGRGRPRGGGYRNTRYDSRGSYGDYTRMFIKNTYLILSTFCFLCLSLLIIKQSFFFFACLFIMTLFFAPLIYPCTEIY